MIALVVLLVTQRSSQDFKFPNSYEAFTPTDIDEVWVWWESDFETPVLDLLCGDPLSGKLTNV